MILDQLSYADLYRHLGPLFAKGFDYLKNLAPDVPLGKYELEGERLFAQVQEYATVPVKDKKWESHRRYYDIQYIMQGLETIYYAPIDHLTPQTAYNDTKDVMYYLGEENRPILLGTGEFMVLGPQDGHKPGCLVKEPETVRKVVLKVARDG